MIGVDMKIPNTCWGCKLTYGHYETRCIFTHECVDDPWYSQRKSSECPLVEIKDEEQKGDDKK